MKRDVVSAASYGLASATPINLDGTNFGLYSINLEAGKRYELIADDPAHPLSADLLDDDGGFLTSQKLSFDKVSTEYSVPQKSGRHRLWLRGESGSHNFKFELHVAPTVGGG